jgi:hypothetical protein
MFSGLPKALRHKLGEGQPDLLITIDKLLFSMKFKITIRGELVPLKFVNTNRIVMDFQPKDVYVNYFHLILKIKKFPHFIKNKDFIKVLIIAKEDELLRKYFPDELRKAKIKNIL